MLARVISARLAREGAVAAEVSTSGAVLRMIAGAVVELKGEGTGTVQRGPAKLIAVAIIAPAIALIQTKCRVDAEARRIADVIPMRRTTPCSRGGRIR